ncbi:uncharacterized protein FFB20_13573 [Fusarium fujikuroi]|uniref:Uncharacterized protein n=2 Tax=Fusarium fujikuroi TaxID=5127 RepID=S0ENB9_GIBF5|nr:uncharacterized protein FFUJ_14160 [Fusarium fujikuroi IMI 58289]KLO85026.1 uncharacterized protein LW93_5978 [Fusarium fujikuroi]KLO90097.1 uncharacterized protein Y057_8452 [Fusarium fujikuroi]KLP10889.1 uncharacterized protein LW94_8780 [Fusarium fujikuroi]QGI88719.1 hypothetical protein CEK25_003675 [Fusarium fujikuroi]CCT76207.1 uncharacterized protein FFUJ_14160 [Fusarium fujikuroi IMI 58289]
MTSLIGSIKRHYFRFWDYMSEEAKEKHVQESPVMIELEPDLAQTPQTSVTEINQPATAQAISPQQQLTDISPCDFPIVEQNLRLGVERLTLGPSTAEKRARRGRVDDDDIDAQPAAKRRRLSDGRSFHLFYNGRRDRHVQ